MAYTYKKLTDVEVVESATTPYLLIEDGGDIKKIAASNVAVPQVKADWNEEDETSPAFIMNKPDLSSVGGGANVVTYTVVSGALQLDGVNITAQAIVDEWNNGSILRINNSGRASLGSVLSITYGLASGSTSVSNANVYYMTNSSIASLTLY